MPVNQENINRWIEQAEINYIGHFIKAWIPFNAWYKTYYPVLRTHREAINEIKANAHASKPHTLPSRTKPPHKPKLVNKCVFPYTRTKENKAPLHNIGYT